MDLLIYLIVLVGFGVIALIPAAIGTAFAGPLGGVVVWCFTMWVMCK